MYKVSTSSRIEESIRYRIRSLNELKTYLADKVFHPEQDDWLEEVEDMIFHYECQLEDLNS
jgi:hypothetical protein